MKIEKIKSTDTNLTFNEVLSTITRNRERIRSLSNMIISSCSIFISISFVIIFFIAKEFGLERIATLLMFLISDLLFISAIFFCIITTYINHPKAVITKLNLLSEESLYLVKEQKNIRISTILLFIGILGFLAGLILFVCCYFE